MLRKLLCCLVCLTCMVSQAQERTPRAVYAELYGGSLIAGVNFDSRFNESSHFGYRVGLAYTFTDIGEFMNCVGDYVRGVNMPLEVNCLMGKREKRSRFEVGLGVNVGLYENKTEKFSEFLEDNPTMIEKSTKFGYFVFLNVGYRYQRPQGLLFRVGLSPKVDFGGECGLGNYAGIFSFVPYLSFGYSF